MPKYCCVCRNNTKKGTAHHFHSFPKDEVLRKEWIRRLQIDFQPSPNQIVCSDHFNESNYSISNYGDKIILKRGSVPIDTNEASSAPVSFIENEIESSTGRSETADSLNSNEVTVEYMDYLITIKEEPSSPPATTDSSCPTDNFILHGHDDSVNGECLTEDLESSDSKTNIRTVYEAVMVKREVEDKGTQSPVEVEDKVVQSSLPGKKSSYDSLSDENVLYFTGMERERFEILYRMVDKFAPVEGSLLWSKKDALIITLHKIRHNMDFRMMEWIFELSRNLISEIFKEVIHKLYLLLKQLDIWNMSLKDAKKYRSIFEFYVVKANVHQLTVSYPTFKLLVGCDELGAVNFISDAFAESTSDQEIVVKSGVLNKLEKGDTILADRGFDISDILESKGVALNIPPSLKGKEQFSEYEVMKTHIIANRKILAEKVSCCAIKNKALVTPLEKSMWPYANKIIYVCFALVNFYKPLKREHPF